MLQQYILFLFACTGGNFLPYFGWYNRVNVPVVVLSTSLFKLALRGASAVMSPSGKLVFIAWDTTFHGSGPDAHATALELERDYLAQREKQLHAWDQSWLLYAVMVGLASAVHAWRGQEPTPAALLMVCGSLLTVLASYYSSSSSGKPGRRMFAMLMLRLFYLAATSPAAAALHAWRAAAATAGGAGAGDTSGAWADGSVLTGAHVGFVLLSQSLSIQTDGYYPPLPPVRQRPCKSAGAHLTMHQHTQ